jgi:hypothetical protein
MHDTTHNEDLEIRTGIKAGDAAAVAGGMMLGGGQATAPGGSTFGSGN